MIVALGLGAVTYAEIAQLCGATVPKDLHGMRPHRLVTDSREIEKGDLFCALQGIDDGHKYVREAARRGANAVLAERDTHVPIPHILVPSVRKALGDWAIGVSDKKGLIRIGITGSVGKTTVKDAVSLMLSKRFSVHATYGNFNNDLGLPFTLLSAPKESEIAVCELGVSHKGEMKELSRILRPHISLITCIGHAHIGAFGTRDSIAEEKLDILAHAEEDGVLFVPFCEPLLSRLLPHGIRRVSVAPFEEKDYAKHGLRPPVDDVARNFALGYANAIAKEFSLSHDMIASGLKTILALETHRHEAYIKEMLFIDDGYNASPESVIGALRYLGTKGATRRVAVLGDMLELGEKAADYHRAVGRFAAKHAERLFFFGAYAEEYAKGAYAAGGHPDASPCHGGCVFSVLEGEKEENAKKIAVSLLAGDAVLFKASRALQVEKMIELIKKQIL